MLIFCVRQGDKYGPEYVRALRAMCRPAHAVFCLGDGPDATVGLRYGLKGWWAKLELFSPELRPYRPFLFLDLDVVVHGSLDHLEMDRFTMVRDFIFPERFNSSVMWVPKETGEIWPTFIANKETHMANNPSDQEFLGRFAEGVFPEDAGIHSYRLECRDEPKGSVICFHGKPKPHEAGGWVRDEWPSSRTPIS